MMEIKSAVVERGWENHMGGDIGAGPSEGTGAVSTLHIYMRTSEECFSRDEGLEKIWVLDHSDKDKGRKGGASSLTVDLR